MELDRPIASAGSRILVVDDDPVNLMALSQLLQPDFAVVAARSGEKAQEILAGSQKPDLILLDVMMPGMSGKTLLGLIKANPLTREIPVIFLTGMDKADDEAEGLQAGAADYIKKPFSPAIVLARVAMQLALRRAQTQLLQRNDFLEEEVARRTHDLRQAKEAAELANRAKGEFLTIMSHELRTPLNGVMGMAQVLQMSYLGEEQQDAVETILNCGQSLLTMIEDMLEYSEATDGGMTLAKTPCQPAACMQELHAHFAPLAAKKKISLQLHVAEEVPKLLILDRRRLDKILRALITNAIQFTEHGQVVVAVSMANPGTDNALLVFSVKDTGIGMAAGVLEKLFQPFFQANATSTRSHGGLGLGLALAKRLAEAMAGSLSVTSAASLGSTFVLTLPLAGVIAGQ